MIDLQIGEARLRCSATLTWLEAGTARTGSLGGSRERPELDGFAVTIGVDEERGFKVVTLRLRRDEGRPPVRLVDLVWSVAGVPAALDRVWHMTFNCWGTPGIVERPAATDEAANPPAWRVAFLSPADATGVTFVSRLPARSTHLVAARPDGTIAVTTQIDTDLEPGQSWSDEPLAIGWGFPGELLGGPPSFRVSKRARAEVARHGGWNSWDYHRQDVTADDIRENLEAIRSNPTLARFVKYIIIDDGWQTLEGEWEANRKFPGAMELIASEIRAAGFVPGIWSAPFMVNRRSELFGRHPEWFVQRDGGPHTIFEGAKGVWGERYFLDPTNPVVRDYVHRLYAKLHSWGFGYFKTDFLTNSYTAQSRSPLPDRGVKLAYHDASRGLLVPHRAVMETIRDAIGPESFWLGCGSIWATGAGLMDGSRTTGDIAPHWFDLTKCAATAFFNGHQHGRVFLNDPDFLVVRGKETSKPGLLDLTDEELAAKAAGTHRSGPWFTASEARIWASLVLLSGGVVTLSDRVAALNETGIDILERTCDYASRSSCEPAFPLDVTQTLPTAALRATPGDELLGLFNWTDGAALPLTRPLPASLAGVRWRDLWSGAEYATAELPRLELVGHECRLLVRR